MSLFLQYGLDALSVGSIYALAALSLALLFSIMDLVNFAFGQLIMVGGYSLFFLHFLPLPVAMLFTILAVIVTSWLMDLVAFRPLRGADASTLLITSFALSFALQSLTILVAGARPKGLELPASLTAITYVGAFRVANLDVVTAASTAVLLAALWLMLKRTSLGMQLRAAAEDFTMARLMGINASRTIASAFAISGFLAGVVALLIVARTGNVSPEMGLQPLLVAFIAIVVGGMGSLGGAVIGGYVLGFLTGLLQAALPVRASPFQDALLFTAVILLLVLRPQGLVASQPSRLFRVR